LRANAVLVADRDLRSLLGRLVEEARDLLQADHAAVVVMGANDRIDELVQVGMPAALLDQVQAQSSWEMISALLRPAATGEGQPDAGYGSAADAPAASGALDLPIRLGDKVYGRLYLRKRPGGVFTGEDEQVVTAFAATAAAAMANASLLEESEQRRRWLVAASELADELLTSGKARPLQVVCRFAMEAARADFAALVVPDEELAVATAVTPSMAGKTFSHVVELERDCRQTIRSGKPRLVNDYGDDDAAVAAEVRIGSVVMVPLVAGDLVEGALMLGRVAGGAEFSEADLAMTTAFARQAAVALAFNAARRRELLAARHQDRDRIAMDLHDHVIQELFGVGMGLEALANTLAEPGQADRVLGYTKALNTTISMIRTRIFQLQPEGHDPAGLQTQILEVADLHTEQLGYAPQLHFVGPIDAVVDAALTDDVLAVTREALSNCARHAQATAVAVVVATRDGRLTLTITDNGRGIGATTRSSGLGHLRRRAERHQGTLDLSSPAAGGTRLVWTARL